MAEHPISANAACPHYGEASFSSQVQVTAQGSQSDESEVDIPFEDEETLEMERRNIELNALEFNTVDRLSDLKKNLEKKLNDLPNFDSFDYGGLRFCSDYRDYGIEGDDNYPIEALKMFENDIRVIRSTSKSDRVIQLSSLFLKERITTIHDRQCHIEDKLTSMSGMGNNNFDTLASDLATKESVCGGSRLNLAQLPSPREDKSDIVSTEKADDFASYLIGKVGEEEKSILLKFEGFVTDLFETARKYDEIKDSSDQSTALKNTVNAICAWEPNQRIRRNSYARPSSSRDFETTVDHPILHAIIYKVIQIMQDVKQQQHLASTENRFANDNESYRRVDSVVEPFGEHLALMIPPNVRCICEVKTVRKTQKKFINSIQKGNAQILGQMAKQLLHSFNFAGLGINDETSVGTLLTWATITVSRMSLCYVGTKETKIKKVSCCVPLIKHDSFRHESVFTKDLDEKNKNGFLLLAGAVKHNMARKIEINLLKNRNQKEKKVTMKHLGSGAFAHVYKIGEGEDKFIKISKARYLNESLRKEKATLSELNTKLSELNILLKEWTVDGHEGSIPQVSTSSCDEGLHRIQGVIRDQVFEIEGLELVGLIASPLNRIDQNIIKTHHHTIILILIAILEFAHRNDIVHLDMRPENIIIGIKNNSLRVMLIDWGCSEKMTGTEVKSFRGCPPYSHDDFLGDETNFTLKADHDFASLAYTIDHAMNGELQWDFDYDRPQSVEEKDKEKRRKHMMSDTNWLLQLPDKDEIGKAKTKLVKAVEGVKAVTTQENESISHAVSKEKSTTSKGVSDSHKASPAHGLHHMKLRKRPRHQVELRKTNEKLQDQKGPTSMNTMKRRRSSKNSPTVKNESPGAQSEKVKRAEKK